MFQHVATYYYPKTEDIADTFKVEARELGVYTRKSSLQSCLELVHVHDSGICATLPSITEMEVVSVDGPPCNSLTDN